MNYVLPEPVDITARSIAFILITLQHNMSYTKGTFMRMVLACMVQKLQNPSTTWYLLKTFIHTDVLSGTFVIVMHSHKVPVVLPGRSGHNEKEPSRSWSPFRGYINDI